MAKFCFCYSYVTESDRRGLYIQGSVAAGSADEFSDVDFRVVIHPKAYQSYISERFDAPKLWGEWIYNEWAGRSWVCVSHFKPFNKIDVLYFKPEEIQPSPWFLLPTEVIYDPKGLIQQVNSYAVLEQRSLLQALDILLHQYQQQVIQLHKSLYLKRTLEVDLDWIDTILKLCNSI